MAGSWSSRLPPNARKGILGAAAATWSAGASIRLAQLRQRESSRRFLSTDDVFPAAVLGIATGGMVQSGSVTRTYAAENACHVTSSGNWSTAFAACSNLVGVAADLRSFDLDTLVDRWPGPGPGPGHGHDHGFGPDLTPHDTARERSCAKAPLP